MAFLPWKPLVRALPYVDREEYIPTTFCRVAALLHALKHVRINMADDPAQFVVSYGGVASFATVRSGTGILSELRDAMSALSTMLGYTGAQTSRNQSPVRLCWRSLANRLTINSFLPCKPITRLPGFVLAGPWSTVEPIVDEGGFTQTGLRLDGVWIAKDGRIVPYHGDDEDVITYAWNLKNASAFSSDRTKFENGLPDTYEDGDFPADIWAKYFPNLDETWLPTPVHTHAYRSLVDSVIVASLLCDDFMSLSGEKPMVLCFPNSPEVDACTNQGKTTAALALTRAIVPGITQPVSMMTGASAPDQRSFAQQLLRYGTACVDEWVPTAKDGHVLSNRNLQSAMTGGRLTIGLAGENSPGVNLRYSMTASCKAGDFPPDLVNRIIPAFFGPLNAETRASESGSRLTSGQASLEIRLAALHYINATDVAAYIKSVPKNTTAWRYPWHVAIATHICASRTGLKPEDLTQIVSDVAKMMAVRMREHAKTAEESGLLTQLREGVHVELPVSAFFDNLTDLDIQQLTHIAEPRGATIDGKRWLTASSLVQARKEAAGLRRAGHLLESLTGLRAAVTDRSLIRAFLTNLRERVTPGQVWPIPGTSYHVIRSTADMEARYDHKVWIRIEPRNVQAVAI
jgi:hypothetical protein